MRHLRRGLKENLQIQFADVHGGGDVVILGGGRRNGRIGAAANNVLAQEGAKRVVGFRRIVASYEDRCAAVPARLGPK